MLCAAHPKMAAGDIVRIYKGLTVGHLGGYASVRRYVEEQGQRPEDLNLWLQFPPPEDG